MDLTPYVQPALDVALAVAVPIAGMLARRGLDLVESKLHLAASAQENAAIIRAVDTGAGVLTAKLAAGRMNLTDVHLGNEHVDQAATVALGVAGAAADAAGMTRETVAAQIVGAVGKALGEDPTVPTVAVQPAARVAA